MTAVGYVYAIDARNGAQLWAARIAVVIGSSPAFVGGLLYIGGDGGEVLAVRASDGTVIWSFETGGSVDSSPAVVNGMVFVGSDDGDV